MLEAGVLGEDESIELLSGHVTCMSPQNTPHRAATILVTTWLTRALDVDRYLVQSQSTLPLNDQDVPEPDVAVLEGTVDALVGGREVGIPLVIEVADTSLVRDRTLKHSIYAANSIPEYWIVNLANRTLEVYRDPSGDEYRERRTLDPTDVVTPQFDASLSVPVADLLPPETAEDA